MAIWENRSMTPVPPEAVQAFSPVDTGLTPEYPATSGRIPIVKQLGRASLRLAFCVLGAVGGAAGGESLAYHTPTQVHLLPGISVTAQPSNNGSELSIPEPAAFPLVNELPPAILTAYVNQPNRQGDNLYTDIHADLPVVGTMGVHLTMNSHDVDPNKLDSNALSALLVRPVDGLEQPVIQTISDRIRHDAAIGAISGTLAVLLLETALARLDAGLSANRRNHHLRSRLLLSGLALTGPTASIVSFETSSISAPASSIPVNPELVDAVPVLAGARVSNSSTLAAFNNVAGLALQVQQIINNDYDALDRNLAFRLKAWEHLPSTQSILHDKDYVIAVDEGGMHCSIPAATKTAPLVMRMVGPRLILMTGNVGFSSSSEPMQTECANLQLTAVQAAEQATGHETDEVIAPGSHDSFDLLNALRSITITRTHGDVQHPFTVLDGKVVAKAGVNILGAATPRRNPYGQSTQVNGHSATPQEQNEALYQAGQAVATTCQNANEPLLIMENSPEEGLAAINNGCGTALIAGEGAPYDAVYNGAAVHVQISAAGNGADCGFRLYEPIDSAGAVFGIEAIDKTTNRIAFSTQIDLAADNTVAPIAAFHSPPITPLDPTPVMKFLDSHGSYAAPNNQGAKEVGDPNAC